jgi:hypothetical protein
MQVVSHTVCFFTMLASIVCPCLNSCVCTSWYAVLLSVFHAVLCCAVLCCSIGLKTVIEAASGNLAASLAALVSSKMNTGAQQKVRRQGWNG